MSAEARLKTLGIDLGTVSAPVANYVNAVRTGNLLFLSGGLPIDVFDGIRKGVAANRSQFYKDLPTPFYGFNRPGAKLSEGLRDSFWRMGMMGGMKGQYDCIKQFSETDFTQDLKRIDVPTLIVHGSDDQIVPIGNAGILSAKLVAGSTLKIYEGADHGLAQSQPDRFNADLLAFAKA